MWATFLATLVRWLVTPFVWMWVGGQRAARREAERTAKVKDEQAKAALDRPASRDDLVDRLRDGGGL